MKFRVALLTVIAVWIADLPMASAGDAAIEIHFSEDNTAQSVCSDVLQRMAPKFFTGANLRIELNPPFLADSAPSAAVPVERPFELSDLLYPPSPSEDNKETWGLPNLSGVATPFELRYFPKPDKPLKVEVSLSSYRYDALQVMKAPFAFHDPKHFYEYISSDSFKEIVVADGTEFVAVAYGGFVHLFSGDHAMTEPSHFYDRSIGGEYKGVFEGSEAFVAAGWGGMDLNHYDPTFDIELMAKDPNFMAAVTLPLIEAKRYTVENAAKFLNLIYVAANPVFLTVNLRDEPPVSARSRAGTWIKEAAVACSAENFELEKRFISELKAGGVTVVPGDRDAFVRWAWTTFLKSKRDFDEWTIQDLDDLVQTTSQGANLVPSKVLENLSNADLVRLEELDQAIEEKRRAR